MSQLHQNIENMPFGQRFSAMRQKRGPLCVGIDPHPELLEAWGLSINGAGVWDFSMRVLDALGDSCGFFKPQSALYEVYGSSGISALTATLRAINDCGAIAINDVKRGDIGSTMQAYARSYLGDGPLESDAVTLHPYLGFESLRPAIDLAAANGKGVFVLAMTSNPEAVSLQDAKVTPDKTVAEDIIAQAGAENGPAAANGYLGHIGLVIGATVGQRGRNLAPALLSANAPILVPGFGAQGATAEDIKSLFGDVLDRIVVSSSRGILRAGSQPSKLQREFGKNLDLLKTFIL